MYKNFNKTIFLLIILKIIEIYSIKHDLFDLYTYNLDYYYK